MTMRKLIVEGDPLKTGGIVLPSGATQSYNGYPVAYIGGMVTCFVCGVTGPIIKAGGGRRFEVAGGEVEILFGLGSYTKDEEVAMEDDEVVCACPKHPQLLSVLSPTVMYDDEMSPLAYTGRVVYTAGADLIGGIWSLAKGTVNLVADQATLVVDGPLGAMGVDSAQQAYDAAMKRNLERVETAKALPGAIADKAVDVWHNPSQLTQAENVGHIAGAVVPVGAAAKLGKAAEVGAAAKIARSTEKAFDYSKYALKEGEKLGDFGENVAKDMYKADGYDTFYNVQNKSGNGVDVVAMNSKNGNVVTSEIKTTQQDKLWNNGDTKSIPLSPAQKEGGAAYTESRLSRATNEDNGYTDGVSTQQAKEAQQAIRDAQAMGAEVKFEKVDVYVDKAGNLRDDPVVREWLKLE